MADELTDGMAPSAVGEQQSANGQPWQTVAKQDIGQWATSMPKDADNNLIDWQWVAALDLAGGIGAGVPAAPDCSAQSVHDALKADYATRDRLEAIIAQCNSTFMTDFDRLIASYRLPRALAYANRRLNDEINTLIRLGEQMHLWKASREKQGRATAVILKPYADAPHLHNPDQGSLPLPAADSGEQVGDIAGFAAQPVTIELDDIQDRTAVILNERAERRKNQRFQKHASNTSMSRANLSQVTSPGGNRVQESGGNGLNGSLGSSNASGAGSGTSRPLDANGNPYPQPDWRDAYLPGRDVDMVMGIDIETTGTDPARDYIIDVGFEFMNMISPKPAGHNNSYGYEQHYYEAGDAYGQARLSFGVTERCAQLGNPFILQLTGIDVRARGPQAGMRMFDEWHDAQTGLLSRLSQQPYVAHNATFEHGWFMLNVAGYAESYRAGHITIIDTMPMSRQWDPGSVPSEGHPYGDNTLDSYAKRQGALDSSHKERHLGLEDAHIMLVAMKHHLAELKAEGRGPWGAGGKGGVGGKYCGRRR